MSQTATLGDVAQFINGLAFKPDDWEPEGRRIIRIQNLTDQTKPYNRSTRQVDSKFVAAPGDILVSWSASLGVFEWNGPDEALVNQHIFRVVPDKRRIDKSYLRHGLEGALIEMQRHLHGATMQHVNRGEFLGTKIFLPPLAEQRRIAAILDQADNLRRKRREALTRIERLPISTFRAMFGDPGSNPFRLPVHPLGKLVENQDSIRIPVKASDRAEKSGKYPYYGASGIIDYVDGFLFEGERLLVGEDGANLLARSTPIAFRADGQFWVNNHAHVLANSGAANLSYLECHFELIDLTPYVSGTAQPKLTRASLDRLPFLSPPRAAQDAFAARVAEIDKLKAQHRAHLAQLDALFASLQHRAFRGEL